MARTLPATAEPGVPASGRPVGPAQVRVTDMARSLDFYLHLDCEVRSAADGWALLCCGPVTFVLVVATAPAHPSAPVAARRWAPMSPLRLPTPDIRALRRRLLAAGVRAGSIIRPPEAPAGEIEVADPDRHVVVLAQPGPAVAFL